MSTNTNTNLWMVIAGAGAIIAGAVIYHLVSSEDEESTDTLVLDMGQLQTIEKDASGTIKLQNFIEIFKLVTKHSKVRIGSVKSNSADERRQALREGNEDKYRELVTA